MSQVQWSRWPAIFLVVVLGLGLLYKVAPNRPANRSPWISPGALTATIAWMAVTVGLSIYTARLASFSATYGALTGVIVLMTHIPLGREVIKRGIIFIDLAVAQIAGLGVIIAYQFGWHIHGIEAQIAAISSALVGAAVLRAIERGL